MLHHIARCGLQFWQRDDATVGVQPWCKTTHRPYLLLFNMCSAHAVVHTVQQESLCMLHTQLTLTCC
jgi:hypothetical protein